MPVLLAVPAMLHVALQTPGDGELRTATRWKWPGRPSLPAGPKDPKRQDPKEKLVGVFNPHEKY